MSWSLLDWHSSLLVYREKCLLWLTLSAVWLHGLRLSLRACPCLLRSITAGAPGPGEQPTSSTEPPHPCLHPCQSAPLPDTSTLPSENTLLLWTGVSDCPPAPLWFLFSFPLSSHLVASHHGPSQSIMRFAVCLIWQLSVGLATEGLAWIFESQRERDCKALWLLPAQTLGDRLRRRGITDSYDGPQVVDPSQASAPPDKNCLTPMSFSYFFSPVVPVSSIVHKYNRICRIHNWLSRPHPSGSKWQWMWHRSGTQSGWRWRSAGNSREGRVHGRTASASSPTLPRAARWKTAELSLVLIHSRWVWQTCTRYIHHRPVLLFLVSPCSADQCFLQKVFSPARTLSALHKRYSCSREGRGLEKQELCQFIC